jgi:hypothetical protein
MALIPSKLTAAVTRLLTSGQQTPPHDVPDRLFGPNIERPHGRTGVFHGVACRTPVLHPR